MRENCPYYGHHQFIQVHSFSEKENMLHEKELPGPGRNPSTLRRNAPPDDILTQWRLRQKMEEARGGRGYPNIRLLDGGRGPASPKKADRVNLFIIFGLIYSVDL